MLVISGVGGLTRGSAGRRHAPASSPEGRKALLGFQLGLRESARSWRALPVDLEARGLASVAFEPSAGRFDRWRDRLGTPKLAVGDGALVRGLSRTVAHRARTDGAAMRDRSTAHSGRRWKKSSPAPAISGQTHAFDGSAVRA